MNAAVAIIAGGKADNLDEAIDLSRQSIDTGSAAKKLNDLCQLSYE